MATVVATAVVMVTLLAAVFWSISRCRPVDCQTYFQKEALPSSLVRLETASWAESPEVCFDVVFDVPSLFPQQSDWDVTFMSNSEEAEPLEAVSVVVVMMSTEDLGAENEG